MDFFLVVPLILALLTTGQSHTLANNSCYPICPAGYYKIDNEREIRPCSFNSNVECGCKEGYYNADPGGPKMDCRQCPCDRCPGTIKTESQRVCMDFCPSCLSNSTCKECTPTITPSPPTTPSTTLSTTPSTTLSTTPSTTLSTTPPTTPHPSPSKANQIFWMFLVGVASLLLFWLLLFFIRNPLRFPDRCPCWHLNKAQEVPVEDPKLNERSSHESSSPTTLTLHISEETPMMPLNQSPATPDPASVGPVPPDSEYNAVRQEAPSGHWPAIVLYAVIKEVPLRRWKEFLRLLSVDDQQLERVELEAGLGLGSMERQYQMLRLWSQRASSNMSDVFSALHYMDLSGCAQLLQESLEKLPWRPETKQGCTDNGPMQDS